MALPTSADLVMVRGYWWDETSGGGVNGTITFDPIPFAGAATPNLLDQSAYGHIKTRQQVATPDPVSGFFAVLLVANDDPDLDPFAGWRVTYAGENAYTIVVPYNAPVVTVDVAAHAALPSLPVNSQVKALWLSSVATGGTPAPSPPSAYLNQTQTLAAIAAGIDAHDADPGAHPAIRALITGGGGGPGSYHHEQPVASSTWIVPHNLGFRPAGVIARDASGLIEPSDITYPDADTCVLSWSGQIVAGSVDLS